MQELIIMQAQPGSGKTTLAKALAWDIFQSGQHVAICSTDSYFYDANGVYRFDPSKLGVYHKANQERAKALLDDGVTVVVDNTNLRCYECKSYVVHAHAKGIPVRFIRATGNYANTHGVPPEKVEQMRAAMEELTLEKVLNAVSPFEGR